MSSIRRPEHTAPPEIFYGVDEAEKYTNNTRIMQIQADMSERALELLALPDEPCYLLDLGCGSGLSGECIEEQGHMWMGRDISQAPPPLTPPSLPCHLQPPPTGCQLLLQILTTVLSGALCAGCRCNSFFYPSKA